MLYPSLLLSASWDPAAADYSGHKGKTIYVSKLGDNSDGSSWQKAFHTIQAALSAVPDDKGGHRIIVRPDTYVEANLYPAQKGAAGAYNLLIGDFDGSLGSGGNGLGRHRCELSGRGIRRDEKRTFKIVKSDLPESGFKAVDWWAPILATTIKVQSATTPSRRSPASVWDRWIFRNSLRDRRRRRACSGTSAEKSGEGFTVIVEDCVGIGRAFGGGVCYPVVRPNEPSVFRRCYFLALDWVGDTAAVLVGGWEKSMPE